MYLLDTNIVSELRRPRPHGSVVAWLETVGETDLYISAVTIGEIQSGIEITRAQNAAKAAELEAWLEQVIATGTILDMDAAALRCCARLMHQRSDEAIEDTMIAATAIVKNLTVVTRKVRDFKPLGVRTINPFEFKR